MLETPLSFDVYLAEPPEEHHEKTTESFVGFFDLILGNRRVDQCFEQHRQRNASRHGR